MKNIAILASGSGTNAENIIKRFQGHNVINIALILSNNSKAGVLSRAEKLNTPAFVFSREEFDDATLVLNILRTYNVEFIILAGFLNKIAPPLLTAFPNKIVNIHPALLPKHGGKGMYGMNVHKAVIDSGDKESGITIHYINEYYDQGAIIFQASCPVLPDDKPEDLAARVHELEYTFYPSVIENLLLEKDPLPSSGTFS